MNIYNINGDKLGEITLKESIINAKVNNGLIHEVLVSELASFRQGTASTKTRGMVRGGGRKPWRQKGTGRARQGSIRSPHWVGGGTVFGPNPERNLEKKVNKKARVSAIRAVLANKIKHNKVLVIDDYDMEKPSLKLFKSFVDKLSLKKNLVVIKDVYNDIEEKLYMSSRNLRDNTTILANEAGVYWLLKYDNIILTKDALERLEERL